jgi:carboxypeptidase Q
MKLACLAFASIVVLFAPGREVRAEPSVRPGDQKEAIARIVRSGLKSGKAHAMLTELCTRVGPRLSGSAGAEKAVAWAKKTMELCGLEKVRLESVMVPRWVRGPIEEASFNRPSGERIPLKICALGGSVATAVTGITARVLEVQSFAELRAAGEKARGKIIFFNRAFDRGLVDPFAAYMGVVEQRGAGANEAAKAGGVAALVRSMTARLDDAPHTGSMSYAPGLTQVPAAAVSTIGADRLSAELARDANLEVNLRLSCETLPDVSSSNVLGEIVGRERPGDVVVIGGHLDSWDLAQGAHDDGAGCVHSIEALRLLKELGLRPSRTIRAVMFMNEENGTRGARAYAAKQRPGETHIAAIESDSGGFLPLGFTIGARPAVFEAISKWADLFLPIEIDRFKRGGGGVDIGPLMAQGVPGLGLSVNHQRYFDFHHSANDTIDAVDGRELELGAIAMAIMSYMLAEEGLPQPGPAK